MRNKYSMSGTVLLGEWNFLFAAFCAGLEKAVSTTPTPDDEDDDWDDEDSSEIDDDGRIYKNPRNSPSPLCPRDEEQATLLVCAEFLCSFLFLFM